MKKLLLSAAFLSATFIGANAQAISFEASEGYTLGDLYNQNGWTVTGDGSGGFVQNQVITSESATDGANSLKIVQETAFPGQSNLIVGGFYNMTTPLSGHYTLSADYFIGQQGNVETDGDYGVYLVGGTSVVAIYRFSYDGSIYTVEGGNWTQVDGVTWTANQWLNVAIEVNGTTVKYYLNGTVIKEGAVITNEDTLQFRFVHDNYGGYAYVDDITFGAGGLNTINFDDASFSVYPNPATNVINISNSVETIDNVTITDLNGRTVKQVTVGVNDAQINISDLAQGIYILNATSNGKSFTQKIVKQ